MFLGAGGLGVRGGGWGLGFEENPQTLTPGGSRVMRRKRRVRREAVRREVHPRSDHEREGSRMMKREEKHRKRSSRANPGHALANHCDQSSVTGPLICNTVCDFEPGEALAHTSNSLSHTHTPSLSLTHTPTLNLTTVDVRQMVKLVRHGWVVRSILSSYSREWVQRYLAHEKTPPPWTLH